MAQINEFEYKKRYLQKNWIITGERNQLADKSFKNLQISEINAQPKKDEIYLAKKK